MHDTPDVFFVGGSLVYSESCVGGYRGICFLNATPFWAFMPHRESIPRALTALLPWDGSLPPPKPIRFLIQNVWWRALRQRKLLQSLLKLVYRNRSVIILNLPYENGATCQSVKKAAAYAPAHLDFGVFAGLVILASMRAMFSIQLLFTQRVRQGTLNKLIHGTSP